MVLKNHASALKSQLSDHTAVEKRQLQDHKAALKALSTEQDKKLQALVDQHALDSSSTAIQLHTLRQQVEQHRGETASVRAACTQEGQAALNDLAAQLKAAETAVTEARAQHTAVSNTLNTLLPLLAVARTPQVDTNQQLLQTIMAARAPQPDASQMLLQMMPLLMRSGGGDREAFLRELREIAGIIRQPLVFSLFQLLLLCWVLT